VRLIRSGALTQIFKGPCPWNRLHRSLGDAGGKDLLSYRYDRVWNHRFQPDLREICKMIVAVHQPQYLPWLGYFAKIDRADLFVLLDNVQFKKNEWQNRNQIKAAGGPQWLTVPVTYKFPQRINEVGINNRERWQHQQRQAHPLQLQKSPLLGLRRCLP